MHQVCVHLRRRNGLMKGITGYKITVSIIGITFCMWRVQPCDSDLKGKFLSLIVCFFYPHFFFFFFFLLTFFVIRIFFSIRIFPSASAIRRYPVRVLQTPMSCPCFSHGAKTYFHMTACGCFFFSEAQEVKVCDFSWKKIFTKFWFTCSENNLFNF